MKIFSREEWGAQDPKVRRRLALPVENVGEAYWCPVTFNKTHLYPTCNNQEECMERVRIIQQIALDTHQSDILYNFLIGGDGNIYEGRGWTTLLTEDSLWSGIVIGYIGQWTLEKPPPDFMKEKFNQLVEYGKSRFYIKKDCIIFPLDRTQEEIMD